MDSQNGTGLLDHNGRPFASSESQIEYIGGGEWKQKNTGPYSAWALPQPLTFQQIYQTGMRAYWHGQFDEAVRFDVQYALAMRRDSFLMGLLNERKYAVANLPWHLEVPDERDPRQAMVRDCLTMALRSTRGFRRMLWTLLDAIWYGRMGVQLIWRWREVMGQRVLCPRAFKPVNGDKITYMFDGTPAIEVFAAASGKEERGGAAQLSNEETDAWGLPNSEFIWTQNGKALVLRGSWRERFVIHAHEMEDRDFSSGDEAEAVFGKGIRDVLFALDWMKREWLANISDYFERVGQGLTLWYWDASNPASKIEVEKAARDQSNRVNIMVPRWPNAKGNNNTGVERLEVPVQGSKFLMELIQYVDGYQRLYVTGQSMSIGADNEGGLGGTGRAEFAESTKGQITAWDSHNVGETMTGDEDEPGFISIMKQWSFPWADFPVWLKLQVKDPASKENLEAIKTVVDMRVPTKASDVRAAAGLSKPGEDDELVPGEPEPQQPGMPGGMPGEDQPGAPQVNGAPSAAPQSVSGEMPVPQEVPAEPARFQRDAVELHAQGDPCDKGETAAVQPTAKPTQASPVPAAPPQAEPSVALRFDPSEPAEVPSVPDAKSKLDAQPKKQEPERHAEAGQRYVMADLDELESHAQGEPCKDGERADQTGCVPAGGATRAMPVQPPVQQPATRAMPVVPPPPAPGAVATRTLPGPLAQFPTVPPALPGVTPEAAREEAIAERDPEHDITAPKPGDETADQMNPEENRLTPEELVAWQEMVSQRPILAALMTEDPKQAQQWRDFNEGRAKIVEPEWDFPEQHAAGTPADKVRRVMIHRADLLIQAKQSPATTNPTIVKASEGFTLEWLLRMKQALEQG